MKHRYYAIKRDDPPELRTKAEVRDEIANDVAAYLASGRLIERVDSSQNAAAPGGLWDPHRKLTKNDPRKQLKLKGSKT